jgi:hypothetical protein
MRKMILGSGLLVVALALPTAFPMLARAVQLNQNSSLANQGIAQDNEPRFTNVIEDLPLMPGLQLMEDEDVLFVTPHSGRIAETNAIGSVDIDDVYKFYRRSLPHLGWKVVDSRTYVREGEKLRIDAHANAKITTVRFTVKPVS